MSTTAIFSCPLLHSNFKELLPGKKGYESERKVHNVLWVVAAYVFFVLLAA